MLPVREIYRRLFAEYGPQGWWPAGHPFEVILGAVLVQRTAWRNAAQAMHNLRNRRLTDPRSVLRCDPAMLAEAIRPAGFWRIKSGRLTAVTRAIVEAGGMDALGRLDTNRLRSFLLAVHGIGEETADAILLYAFDRPAVVVDAYLRRLNCRLDAREQHSPSKAGDRLLRERVGAGLDSALDLNEFHALVVEHGKNRCRSEPDCGGCCLTDLCAHGREARARSRAPGAPSGYRSRQPNPSPRR